ncbi:hypothetical protein GCM10022236_34150 [Microlunatus ginsengisoli]|uniref:Uncharacterized protein n=1 Tax=Microlunatus ginsengisoli TaxID=363863 RepID=A0ABP7AC22_9ACTN
MALSGESVDPLDALRAELDLNGDAVAAVRGECERRTDLGGDPMLDIA